MEKAIVFPMPENVQGTPNYLFEIEGMHNHRGRLYMPFTPPSIIHQTEEFEMREGDVLFGTFPRSGEFYVFLSHADGYYGYWW